MPFGDTMDICSPGGALLLALMKVRCYIDGCCYGKTFYHNGTSYHFPSQIVECIAGLLLAAVLILMLRKMRWRRMIGAYWFVFYGSMCFVLNFFRETTPWIGPIPAGTFWSIIAIIIGLLVLFLHKMQKRKPVTS